MKVAAVKERRSERLEVRTTPQERQLIDRAVAASGVELTEFVVTNLALAARRVLADRTEFALDDAQRQRWDELSNAPAQSLPGLNKLMARRSPFIDE
jgi:uncharacterized protein (DUF1778 family)